MTALDSIAAVADSLRRVVAAREAIPSRLHGDTLAVSVVSEASGWRTLLGQIAGAVLTAVVAVSVFTITQAIARLAIEPAVEVRRVINRIGHALVFHADVHANPGVHPSTREDEVRKVYRDLSSELRAAAASIPAWARGPLALLKVIPKWEDVVWSAKRLMALSNGISPVKGVPDQGVRNTGLADGIRGRLGVMGWYD